MALGLGSLFFNVQAQTTPFEREMARVPQIVDQAQTRVENRRKRSLEIQRQIEIQLGTLGTATQREVTNEIIRQIEREERARTLAGQRAAAQARTTAQQIRGAFSAAFSGGFFGAITASITGQILRAVGSIPREIGDIFNKGLQTQGAEIALAAITGSMEKARLKIEELTQTAKDTPGLTLESAIKGQASLEAISFSAERATKLLVGMAKVRILSFADKGAYDRAIYNLSQIGSSARLSARDLRELIQGMPYAAKVINDTFGSIDPEVIRSKTKNAGDFLEQFTAALEKVPVPASNANLAVENLGDSIDQWEKAVGKIISRNPELIALFETITLGVDDSTKSFKNNESAATKSLESTISWLGKAGISAIVFGKYVGTSFNVVALTIVKLIGGVRDLGFGMQVVAEGISRAFQKAFNSVNSVINGIYDLVKGIPTPILFSNPLTAPLAGLSQIPKTDNYNINESDASFEKRIYERAQEGIDRDKFIDADIAAQWKTLKQSSEQLRTTFDRFTEQNRKANRETDNIVFGAGARAAKVDSSDLASGKAAKKNADELKKELEQINKDFFIGKKLAIGDGLELRKNLEGLLNNPKVQLFLQTVKVAEGGAPNIMAGGRRVNDLSRHPGETVPMSQWFRGPAGASSAAGNFQITRTNFRQLQPTLGLPDFSEKSQAIAALELMRQGGGTRSKKIQQAFVALVRGDLETAFRGGTQDWASSSFSTLPGGKKNYIKIAKSLKGSGALDTDKFDNLENFKKDDNEEFKKETLGFLIKLNDRAGIGLTDKAIKDLLSVINKDLPDREKSTENDLRDALSKRQPVGGMVDARTGGVSDNITLRTTPDEDYLQSIKDELQTEQKIQAVLMGNRNLTEEISERFYNSIVEQGLSILSNERALGVLQQQNADANFVAKRRAIALSNEVLTLTQQETDFNDQLANLDGNRAYRESVKLLGETVDLKQQSYDLEAQIRDFGVNSGARVNLEIEREKLRILQDEENAAVRIAIARMQLDRQTEFNAKEAKAKVLEFLASQQNFTDLVANTQITAMQGAFDGVDKGFDALINKIGLANTAFGGLIKDILSGLAKLAISRLFQSLFGGQLGAGGGGEQPSGGGGGFLSRIFGAVIGAFTGGFSFGGGGGAAGATRPRIAPATRPRVVGFADGGEVKAMSGGMLSLIGEAGYDETVLSTDPNKRGRTQMLLDNFSNRTSLAPRMNYSAARQQSEPARVTINNHFHANEKTGAFSQPSAQQQARQASQFQEKTMRRR